MGGYPNWRVVPRSPTVNDIDGPKGTLAQPLVANENAGPSTVVLSSHPCACPVLLLSPQDVGLRTYLFCDPLRMNESRATWRLRGKVGGSSLLTSLRMPVSP